MHFTWREKQVSMKERLGRYISQREGAYAEPRRESTGQAGHSWIRRMGPTVGSSTL